MYVLSACAWKSPQINRSLVAGGLPFLYKIFKYLLCQYLNIYYIISKETKKIFKYFFRSWLYVNVVGAGAKFIYDYLQKYLNILSWKNV